MNSNEITSALRLCPTTSRFFLGVYANNQIPSLCRNKSGFYVYNTEPAYRSGDHWNLVLNLPPQTEHFDALGRKPPNYVKGPTDMTFNTTRVQSPFSTTCGQHVIYVAFLRCYGISYNNILHNFYCEDTRCNDLIVSKFLKNHFGIINDVTDISFILSKLRSFLLQQTET